MQVNLPSEERCEDQVMPPLQPKVAIKRITSYATGLIGRVTEMQGIYYENVWNMGVEFEALAAEGLAELCATLIRLVMACG
jgi:hypothetical protein